MERIIIKNKITAIVFGVDETIIDNLNVGYGYKFIKGNLGDKSLQKEFQDYNLFGLRREYNSALINEKLDVILLYKEKTIKYDVVSENKKGYLIDRKNINDVLYEIDNEEISNVDNIIRMVRLYCENTFNIKELIINTKVKGNKTNEDFNSRIPFPDRLFNNNTKLHLEDNNETKKINRYLRKFKFEFNDLNFDSKVLNNACFLYDQSYYAPVMTMRFVVSVSGLEALLVDKKNEISYRLERNCAMLLSKNISEYQEYIKSIHKIYNIRSRILHDGFYEQLTEEDVKQARELLRKTIFAVIKMNKTQKELIQYLELKGYIR